MHNPGLSEKAWRKLHVLLAELNLKYPANRYEEGAHHGQADAEAAV